MVGALSGREAKVGEGEEIGDLYKLHDSLFLVQIEIKTPRARASSYKSSSKN